MGGGRLKAVLFLVLCAATSLTWALYEVGIPHCKDIKQQKGNADEWEPIGNIRNDCQMKNVSDNCTRDITLFEDELKNLTRCRHYSVKREPCVMAKSDDDNNIVHMLLLLLDVKCSDGNQGQVDSCLMCFHSVQKHMTTQASSTVSSTETLTSEIQDSDPMSSTQKLECFGGIVLAVSFAVILVFVVWCCRKRSRCTRLPRPECTELGGYRRCDTDDS
ncbi:uncharacterized protein LOC134776044 [Penaeus indicus]|uniref:uncharacterized protein LOC134776044 n=1 Tax=Penaeus indicus TaxID=29960 RepID=UPI00300CCB26